MVIHVGMNKHGKHFAMRTFPNTKIDPNHMATRIFTIHRKKEESMENFVARVKKKARKLGIENVERLD
ncbi:hypothetical protein ACFL1U_02250 [Patescibacteria group bacterium]